MADLGPGQSVDIDELAKEKVQEVERLLDSSENQKLVDVDQCFPILKQIITAADLHRTNDKSENHESNKAASKETNESIYADFADDNEQFHAVDLTEQFATNSVKWTIRVKAFKQVHRLALMLTHPDKSHPTKLPLLKQLPDLVRLSFVAATSPYDDLKVQGFEMFKFLIVRFSAIEERGFPGVSILCQYRTQVLSALKPAFNLDAPPYITAIASQVCCLWICQGFEKDLINLKRTFQLMLFSIQKLENQSLNQNSKLYTECELEQERLDILGSWAQLYITGKGYDDLPPNSRKYSKFSCSESDHLNELVKNHLRSLIDKWWEALKDYALLIMPSTRIVGNLHEHENVYTKEVALRLFEPIWPRIVLASTIWLCSDDFQKCSSNCDELPYNCSEDCDILRSQSNSSSQIKYFKFICGIVMRELCSCNFDDGVQKDFLPESTLLVLKSLSILVNNDEMKTALAEDLTMAQEFYSIIYSILVGRIRARTSHHLFLRGLLGQIFNLVVFRIANRSDYVRYGLSYLTNELKANISEIDSTSDTVSAKSLETLRTNITIRLSNTINIIKLSPEEDPNQFNPLIEVLRMCLANQTELTIGATLLDQLKDFYARTSPRLILWFVNNLFPTKSQLISNLLNTLENEQSLGKDRLIQCLSYIEAYSKSMQDDIRLTSDNDNLIDAYIRLFLDKSHGLESFEQISSIPSRKKELLELCLKYIKELDTMLHDRLDKVMTADMKTTYESALSLQREIRSEAETKRNLSISKKPSTSIAKAKHQTKIVLKADFSNFYAKKI